MGEKVEIVLYLITRTGRTNGPSSAWKQPIGQYVGRKPFPVSGFTRPTRDLLGKGRNPSERTLVSLFWKINE